MGTHSLVGVCRSSLSQGTPRGRGRQRPVVFTEEVFLWEAAGREGPRLTLSIKLRILDTQD